MNSFLILILFILIILYVFYHFKRNKLPFNKYNLINEFKNKLKNLLSKQNSVIEKYGNDMIDKIFSQSIYYLNNEPILKNNLTFKNMPVINIYHKDKYEPNLQYLKENFNNIYIYNNTQLNDLIDNNENLENCLYFTDVYDYYKNHKNYNALTICNIPKYLYLFSSKDITLIQNTNENTANNKIRIGALNNNDIILIKSVIKSQVNYENLNNYDFKIIEETNVIQKTFSENNEIDIFVYFGYEQSILLNQIKNQKFYIVSYIYKLNNIEYKKISENQPDNQTDSLQEKEVIKSITSENSLNKDILKFYIPFSKTKIKNIDRNIKENNNNSDKTETQNNNKKSTTGFSNSTTFIMEVLEIDTILFTIVDNTNNEIENNTFNYLNKKLNNNEDNHKFNKMYLYLLNYYSQIIKINYYLQFFNFLDISKDFSLNNQTKSFSNLIEKFSINKNTDDNSLKLNINEKDLIAFNTKEDNRIIQYRYLKNLSDDENAKGIPIQLNDRLYYEKGLGNFKELHKFYVYNKDDKYIYAEDKYKLVISNNIYNKKLEKINFEYIPVEKDLIKKELLEIDDKVFVYFIKNKEFNKLYKNNDKLNKYFGNSIDKINKINTTPVFIQEIFNDIQNKKLGVITTNKYEEEKNKLIKFKINGDAVQYYIKIDITQDQFINNTNKFEPSYQCYEDNTILTKTECISKVDKNGNNKLSYHWDKPCVKNIECPFYLSNKNYKNERGGCVDGYCEIPIGLKRTSYKTYDTNITEKNYPRCHGCDINDEPDCCEKQKLTNKSKTPNYMFKNDSEDRRLSKFF